MKYSLRRLANLLAGRKDFVEEEIYNVERVKEILESIESVENSKIVIGELTYLHPKKPLFSESVTPQKSREWVSKIFKPITGYPFKYYFEAVHETYSGSKGEKHYITLSNGGIVKKYNQESKLEMRKANLEFLLKNKN